MASIRSSLTTGSLRTARSEVWAVHFVLCDSKGEWVITDPQNSHQADFQRVAPKTVEDCDRLVVERLKALLP